MNNGNGHSVKAEKRPLEPALFTLGAVKTKLFASLVFLLAILSLFLIFKTFLGNSIARGADQVAVAEFSQGLAPQDPQSYYSAGVLLEQSMLPEDLPASLSMYEKAAAIAPYDFRYWLELGKAKERSGETEAAGIALRRATALAPNYADVLWSWGSYLIRRERYKEGFAALRKAVNAEARYAPAAAGQAWDVYGGDFSKVSEAVGSSLPVRAALAVSLANKKRFDEALETWNSIPPEEMRGEFSSEGRKMAALLLANKKVNAGVAVIRQVSDPDTTPPRIGRVSNGGFEERISTGAAGPFDWKITGGQNASVGISVEERHGGERSLVFIFDSAKGNGFRTLSQTVAVTPKTRYRFRFFYRSALDTSATYRWKIADGVSGKVIAESSPLEARSGWRSGETEFSGVEGTEAVLIRLERDKCPEPGCRISGKLWFDDVSVTPLKPSDRR